MFVRSSSLSDVHKQLTSIERFYINEYRETFSGTKHHFANHRTFV